MIDPLGPPECYAICLSSAGLAGVCAADGSVLTAVREAREARAAAVRDLAGGGAVGPGALAGRDAGLRHGRVRRE
ncbi:hypothetical protein PUR56_14445, partial [Streptomyces sp. BE303]|nr:hypothetical protein [Streptomyces sp. BE303]